MQDSTLGHRWGQPWSADFSDRKAVYFFNMRSFSLSQTFLSSTQNLKIHR